MEGCLEGREEWLASSREQVERADRYPVLNVSGVLHVRAAYGPLCTSSVT